MYVLAPSMVILLCSISCSIDPMCYTCPLWFWVFGLLLSIKGYLLNIQYTICNLQTVYHQYNNGCQHVTTALMWKNFMLLTWANRIPVKICSTCLLKIIEYSCQRILTSQQHAHATAAACGFITTIALIMQQTKLFQSAGCNIFITHKHTHFTAIALKWPYWVYTCSFKINTRNYCSLNFFYFRCSSAVNRLLVLH